VHTTNDDSKCFTVAVNNDSSGNTNVAIINETSTISLITYTGELHCKKHTGLCTHNTDIFHCLGSSRSMLVAFHTGRI
jgi:hypothetical protein